MTKTATEKLSLYHTTKRILILIGLAATAATIIATALTFFAKASTVQRLDQRIGLSIGQDNIDREKSNLRWMQTQVAFERRKEPTTVPETTIIKAAENELAERVKIQNDRVKRYEEQHNEKAQL